jgi:hypothetical protein
MSYVKRMLQLSGSRGLRPVELVIIATLAFSLGAATRWNGQPSVALMASEVRMQPAVEGRGATIQAQVPYETGWQLYDNGWAGGPRMLPQN